MAAPVPLPFADAVGILSRGGVLLMGTDTLPGFHCRADRPEAIRRILAAKGREAGRTLLVLAGSVRQARLVTGDLDARQVAFCDRCWPGPFSLILPAGPTLPGAVDEQRGTVAVRVPAVASLRRLVLAVGFPLVSTSVNLSGQPPCRDLGQAWAAFRDKVDGAWQPAEEESNTDLAVDGGPSALVDVTAWPPRTLRSGPVPVPAAAGGSLDGGSGGV